MIFSFFQFKNSQQNLSEIIILKCFLNINIFKVNLKRKFNKNLLKMQDNNPNLNEIAMDIDDNSDAPPVGLYNPESNNLVPIKFADVDAQIHDNFAKVTINHYYENLYSKAIDTEFVFPKTKNAVFDSLKASLDNGETIIAEILSNEEGNKKFQEAKEKGDLAVLADIDKNTPDLVKSRIGNLAPGQKVKITFSYVTQLDISMDKAYLFKFANVFIPRYSSNNHKGIGYMENPYNFEILPKIKFISEADIGALNEQFQKMIIEENENNLNNHSSNLANFENFLINYNHDFVQFTSGKAMLYPWAMKVTLKTSFKFSDLKYNKFLNNQNNNISNSNLFDVKINETNTEAILETNLINFQFPKKDVIITFLDSENFKTPFLILNEHPLHRNEFALYFRYNPKYLSEPKANAVPVAGTNTESSNYLFVIDRSGSMAGSRMETAKSSLVYFLKSLPEESKFNIISFGSSYEFLYKDFIKANDKSIKETLNKVNKFKADLGGTELSSPFQKIFGDWKKNLCNFKEYEKIRIFVLTDGSIDNPDIFLRNLKQEMDYFSMTKIDMKVYSLGIGSGSSEYLIKGIAEKGNGKSELAWNNDDIVEKVIYLLDNSMKKDLKNFKIYFENNQKLNDSLIANSDVGGQFNVCFKLFNETIEFFSRIEIDKVDFKNLDNTNLIVSYLDVDNSEEKFVMPLSFNMIKDDDTLFKIWINQKVDKYFLSNYYSLYSYNNLDQNEKLIRDELTQLCIKYQCLNRLTSLFMILKEKNITEDMKDKKFISLANSDNTESNLELSDLGSSPSNCNNLNYNLPSLLSMPMTHIKKDLCMPQANSYNMIEPPSISSFKIGEKRSLERKIDNLCPPIKAEKYMCNMENELFKKNVKTVAIEKKNSLQSFSELPEKKSSNIFGSFGKTIKNIFSFGNKKKKKAIPNEEQNFDELKLASSNLNRCKASAFNMNDNFNQECIENNMNMDVQMEYENEEEDNNCYQNQNLSNKNECKFIQSSSELLDEKSTYKENEKRVQSAKSINNPQVKNIKDLEEQILNNQNFNGSWGYNGTFWNSIGNNKKWKNIYDSFIKTFENLFSNLKTKEIETVAFTIYVLNFIQIEITETKTLNKLKLIIAKAEKFVNTQIKIDNIYTSEIKKEFELL